MVEGEGEVEVEGGVKFHSPFHSLSKFENKSLLQDTCHPCYNIR